jgi:hypothetical protein
MVFSRLFVSSALLLVVTAAAPLASADPIAVTSGEATVRWGGPSHFDLKGDGFHLGSVFVSVPVSPQRICRLGCAPGTTVNLSAVMGGMPGVAGLGSGAVAVVEGVPFRMPGELLLHLEGELFFEAPDAALPQVLSARSFLTAPFQFNGHVAGFRTPGSLPLFQVDLVGRGIVSAQFEGVEGNWGEPTVTYAFSDQAPIPEPVSVLLVGSGLAGILLRCGRTARQARS